MVEDRAIDGHTVGIVLEVAFGDRLPEVARRMHVWIVDSPANRAVADLLWRDDSGHLHHEGVTTFKFDPTDTPEQRCIGILPTVDLHHGDYSYDPPYCAVEVFDCPSTEALRTEFIGFGSTVFFSERHNGFCATVGR